MTIAQEWTEFAASVLPANAHPVQVQEMRRAFFGGVWATLCRCREISGEDISEEAGVEMLENWSQECEAFRDDMLAGRA
jgi:hypothetical protein